MIEVRIPKDLDHYEAKFIGPFSLRQTVCMVAAIPVAICLFNIAKAHLGTDVAGFLCFIPFVVAWLFGWLKPYGMKFEVFLRSIFITSVLAPKKRKYKTKNYYKMLMSEEFNEDEDDFLMPQSKKKKKSSSSNNYQASNKAIF